MIRRADERFAHRFAGGPPPKRPPKHGPEHARHQREGWYRHLLAFAISSALLLGMVWMVGDQTRTESLSDRAALWALILGIDFVWSFSYVLAPQGEGVVVRSPGGVKVQSRPVVHRTQEEVGR